MIKYFFLVICFFCFIPFGKAQQMDSDHLYTEPLSEVIQQIEDRFHVHIRIREEYLKDKVLTYALWRFRPDLHETMNNVFMPFDYRAYPDGAPDKFKVEPYKYYLRTVAEAKETLDYLAGFSETLDDWNKRRAVLLKELPVAVRLPQDPGPGKNSPIIRKVQKRDGYTFQNIAIEVLPGVYECATVYRPAKINGKIPLIMCPNGHFQNGRYNPDIQARCAGLARMGAMTVSYDLFAWGESTLQFDEEDHHRSLANTVQVINTERILDYLLSFSYVDTMRIGITGGSGGGSHTILMSALDNRFKLSVPVVMLSAIHYGGCPCESGNPIHLCGGGTNNVELAALFAPKPQLIVSDGGDWTRNVPKLEFPFLKRVYKLYQAGDSVENVHIADEGHSYGPTKRIAMYHFMIKHFHLQADKLFSKSGKLDESVLTIEPEDVLKTFVTKERLPKDAIYGFNALEKLFSSSGKGKK